MVIDSHNTLIHMQQPTAPELEILKLLWSKQPLTAREIHDELATVLSWGYSSTRKTLERMGDKGFIACETLGNKNSYTTLVDKMPTLAAFAQDFAKRVFELNEPLPVAMFASSKLVNAHEIADLEKLLADLASPPVTEAATKSDEA
ncbi:Predicted transcriptional regulator [Rheinheimera pacifica]|uniref:Predicted transcriptional regulator n=1 Tax=Rheinheimera pacifica TaxID=173990 RepID=A0A1H6KP57_9GAMM|nr:BlaI/MecI/CopY family transcriptional regulator [Rheinheimera pacifica]SEH77517.1 Predicted transcriptional regulator [Rheinheimera pacifica]